ncbi:MAG: hypothetical protein IPN34_22870 [Planctomycetes bacterium]|nr:hypothetical protein [Planctomycetota bacterium]
MHAFALPRPFALAAIALCAPLLSAQQLTVDYPDSVLNAPQGQYPVYTPPAGGTVRGQILCPPSFAGLPTTPRQVTRVGVQIAGQELYAEFVVRAGSSTQPSLTPTWATNLPDQRVQLDLSNTVLQGGLNGTTAVNQWVEFPLANPFQWTPGESIVVDITARSAVAGVYCRTAIGTGVGRCLNTAYTGQATGSVITSGGIKIRIVFDDQGWVRSGVGCADSTSTVVGLVYAGNLSVGQPITLGLTSGTPLPYFLMGGISNSQWLGIALPLDLGLFERRAARSTARRKCSSVPSPRRRACKRACRTRPSSSARSPTGRVCS